MTEKQEKELEQKLYKNFWCYGDSLKNDTLQIDPTLTPKELATWINQNFISRDEVGEIIEEVYTKAYEEGLIINRALQDSGKEGKSIMRQLGKVRDLKEELKSKYLA